jgi:hypothetical protein
MRILMIANAVVASIAVSAQSVILRRGETVRVVPTDPSDSTPLLVLKVVALPSEHIHIVNDRLYVNDIPVAGFSADFLTRVARRTRDEVVPAGHYYVMGEGRINDAILEHSGVYPRDGLKRAR